MNKIVIIVCYFGKFPSYFNLWLKSAGYNSNIDFLIFSDNNYEFLPSNVKIINTTLDDIKILAEKKLGFKISLNRPYKLCDYRVVYGYLFSEYIYNYDWWGHCDIDMIFGDIMSFLNDNILKEYEKIYQLGHLTLYKNNEKVNNCYKLEGGLNYKEVYSNDMSYAFDETKGIQQIFLKNKFKVYLSRDYADISSIYRRFRLADFYLNTNIKINNYKYQLFYWEKGKIFRAYYFNKKLYKDEFNYIHFKERNFKTTLPDNVKSFYITPKGFIEKKDKLITKKIIQKYNNYNLFKEICEYLIYNVKTIIYKIKRKLSRKWIQMFN